jgi:ribosomal protein S27E
MRTNLGATPTNPASLRIRCPDCSHKYHINMFDSGDMSMPRRGNSGTFRPAFKRAMQAVGEFYSQAIYEQRCRTCQNALSIHLIDNNGNDESSDLLRMMKNLPTNFYVYTQCSNCGISLSDLTGLHIYDEKFRSFLLDHTRIVVEPAVEISYNGQDAIRSSIVDPQSGERMMIITQPQTLHLLATLS